MTAPRPPLADVSYEDIVEWLRKIRESCERLAADPSPVARKLRREMGAEVVAEMLQKSRQLEAHLTPRYSLSSFSLSAEERAQIAANPWCRTSNAALNRVREMILTNIALERRRQAAATGDA